MHIEHVEEDIIALEKPIPLPVFARNGRVAIKKLLESHTILENGIIAGFCGAVETIISLWDKVRESRSDVEAISKINIISGIGADTGVERGADGLFEIGQESCQFMILKTPIPCDFGMSSPDRLSIELPEIIMKAMGVKIGEKTIMENLIDYLTDHSATWVLKCDALEDKNFKHIYDTIMDLSDPYHDEENLQDIYKEMDLLEAQVISFDDESALETLYCQNGGKIETLVGLLKDTSLQEVIVTMLYIDVPKLYERLYTKFVHE